MADMSTLSNSIPDSSKTLTPTRGPKRIELIDDQRSEIRSACKAMSAMGAMQQRIALYKMDVPMAYCHMDRVLLDRQSSSAQRSAEGLVDRSVLRYLQADALPSVRDIDNEDDIKSLGRLGRYLDSISHGMGQCNSISEGFPALELHKLEFFCGRKNAEGFKSPPCKEIFVSLGGLAWIMCHIGAALRKMTHCWFWSHLRYGRESGHVTAYDFQHPPIEAKRLLSNELECRSVINPAMQMNPA
ncbi:hypothetical protein K438DRAFT_1757945 [Mycena galopus ATCC 62051]|nr:hypothetical protein K438DRAFT_1757945 [Mycena galopus ATCC 62051]